MFAQEPYPSPGARRAPPSPARGEGYSALHALHSYLKLYRAAPFPLPSAGEGQGEGGFGGVRPDIGSIIFAHILSTEGRRSSRSRPIAGQEG
jgi:hypothetical protein